MSEEEKKAIIELNHYINITAYWKQEEYTNSEIDNYIKILLNLIEKQQKEIEELNDFIKENPPVIPFIPEDFKKGDDFADLVTLKNKEYISKDKIKEILNNTEKNIEEDRPSIVLENLILNIKELLGE